MSRPKKKITPVKEHQLPVRFSDELYEVLSKDAASCNMTRGEYIRHLVASKTPIAKYEVTYNSQELLSVFRNLGSIGSNLNQIARYLNQGGLMTNEMWKDVTSCIAQLRHMRDQVKEMAGEYRGNG